MAIASASSTGLPRMSPSTSTVVSAAITTAPTDTAPTSRITASNLAEANRRT